MLQDGTQSSQTFPNCLSHTVGTSDHNAVQYSQNYICVSALFLLLLCSWLRKPQRTTSEVYFAT